MNRSIRKLSSYILLLCIASSSIAIRSAEANDNPLTPTPLKSAEEALAHAKRTLKRQSSPALPPKAVDLTGALSRLDDGRIGFMPLLQHHMSVEHWFVSGADSDDIKKALKEGKGRCYVRLRGTATMLGAFGGSFLKWYGNGLAHGRSWGPVMGYHERVYTLDIKEVVWVHQRDAINAARSKLKATIAEARALLGSIKYAEALPVLDRALDESLNAGHDHRDITKLKEHALRMVMLTSDPAKWTDVEKKNAIDALMLRPTVAFRELKKKSGKHFADLIASWPESLRMELAPRAIHEWKHLEYKHQLKAAGARVTALGGPNVEAWQAQVKEAATKIEAAKTQLATLASEGKYREMMALVEAMKPYQALDRSYAFAEGRLKFWLPAATKLIALDDVMNTPDKRMPILLDQLKRSITGGSGLPNSNAKPRYMAELTARVFPKLTGAELGQIETQTLKQAKALDLSKDWQQVLLAAEALSGCGSTRSAEFLDALVARMGNRPGWQRKFVSRFTAVVHARVGAKAK